MKTMTPLFFVTLVSILMALPSIAKELDGVGNPLGHAELEQYRGGFSMSGESLINIGISISTGLNGEQIYQSHIAELTILNGVLIATALPATSSEGLLPSVSGDNMGSVIQLGSGNVAVTAEGFIGSVIQNTLDNQVINLQTTVDIRAEVDGIVQQAINSQRMQDALLFSQ